MKYATLIAVLAFASLAAAQTPPAKDEGPKLTEKAKADILAQQLKISQIENQYYMLQQSYNQELEKLKTQSQQAQDALTAAKKAACDELKIDCEKDYTLDTNASTVTKKDAGNK